MRISQPFQLAWFAERPLPNTSFACRPGRAGADFAGRPGPARSRASHFASEHPRHRSRSEPRSCDGSGPDSRPARRVPTPLRNGAGRRVGIAGDGGRGRPPPPRYPKGMKARSGSLGPTPCPASSRRARRGDGRGDSPELGAPSHPRASPSWPAWRAPCRSAACPMPRYPATTAPRVSDTSPLSFLYPVVRTSVETRRYPTRRPMPCPRLHEVCGFAHGAARPPRTHSARLRHVSPTDPTVTNR